MAKKKPPAKRQPEPEVLAPDPLGGMSIEAYHSAVLTGVQEALGEADIETVGAVLDESVAEYLAVVDHIEGRHASRSAALKFGQTIIPYAMKGLPEPGKTYAQLRLERKDE